MHFWWNESNRISVSYGRESFVTECRAMWQSFCWSRYGKRNCTRSKIPRTRSIVLRSWARLLFIPHVACRLLLRELRRRALPRLSLAIARSHAPRLGGRCPRNRRIRTRQTRQLAQRPSRRRRTTPTKPQHRLGRRLSPRQITR